MSVKIEEGNDALYLSFNQTKTCFSVASSDGFQVFSTEPMLKISRKNFEQAGGIGIIEMCYQTNIFALVGGTDAPRFHPNKVMVWDETQSKCIGELSFGSEVKGIKLRRDLILVALEGSISVHNFQDLKTIEVIKTAPNEQGLVELCYGSSQKIFAFPGVDVGTVIVNFMDVQRKVLISAHDSRVFCLGFSNDGTLLATASEKGTLLRIFESSTGNLLHEFRRGAEKALIFSICFSPNKEFIACTSDKGTVHVFTLKDIGASNSSQTLLSKTGIKYFDPSRKRSIVHFRVRAERSICCFANDFPSKEEAEKKTKFDFAVIVIANDRSFFKVGVNVEEGLHEIIEHRQFHK